MDTNTGLGILVAIFACGLGAITAKIASDRGVAGEPIFWFVGGALLAIIVLPLAIFLPPDPAKVELKGLISGGEKKCPKCAELVKREALICRYCRYEFGPNDDWRMSG